MLSEERMIELYQIGYKKGYEYGKAYVANGNRKVVRPHSSKADLKGYSPEEKVYIHNGYRAGYGYGKTYAKSGWSDLPVDGDGGATGNISVE